MTFRELYRSIYELLKKSGTDSPESDAMELVLHFTGMNRVSYLINQDCQAEPEMVNMVCEAAEKRSEGYPLQYISGCWSFMDCELLVGEGVLIPRDDTEVCVREVLKYSWDSPLVIDLCSGSGAIAIAVARNIPGARVIAAELSDAAFVYLEKNTELNGVGGRVVPVKCDIKKCYDSYNDGSFDVIISNPPYIRKSEIPSLQKEVRCEPEMALDGGEDGLDFYRTIAEKWVPKLKSGGIIALEIGEEQGEDVRKLLENNGITELRIVKDIQGLDRTVIGRRSHYSKTDVH